MRVFVKNKRGEALMPCSNKKARMLLKTNKATIFCYNPFTIQLTEATGETVQPVSIGIDTGARFIGVAITSEDKVLTKGEIELRQDVSEKVTARRLLRNARRARKTRYRPARFLNRKRKDGWLPPSVKSKLDATFYWIDKFCSLVPNPVLHIEVGKFDVAKMINPDISGTDYQNGNTKDYYDVRYYVFARDNYTCQVCKKRKPHLRTHHIVYKSNGGTNRAGNLITVCDECHTSENHKAGGIFYRWMENHKKVKQYKEPTFMNIVRKRTIFRYPVAEFTYGSVTAPNRINLGLEKTHYNDAIAISGIEHIKRNPAEHFYYKQFRKKKRSLHEQTARKARTGKNTNAVRNCKNVKQRAGFFLNDKVLFQGKVAWVYGFACGEKGKACVLRDIEGNLIRDSNHPSFTAQPVSRLKILCHNNGWQHQTNLS